MRHSWRRWRAVLSGAVLGLAVVAVVRAATPPPIGPVYVTPDGLRQMWIYDSRGNKNLLIVHLPTGALRSHFIPMADRVVAYSNDLAVTGTSVNAFHVTGVQNSSLNASLNLPVRAGTSGTDAALVRALFVTPTRLHLTTRNGATYYYDAATRALSAAPGVEEALAVDPSPTATPADITVFPRRLSVMTVLPAPAAGAVIDGNPVLFDFNTNHGGWAGVGLDSDEGGTPALETLDLSAPAALTLGFKAPVARVKLELVDEKDRKHVVYPRGLVGTVEKVWVFPLDTARRVVDLRKLRFVFVIVEQPASVGRLALRREPAFPSAWGPSALGPDQIAALPRSPSVVRFAPAGDASVESATSRGLRLDFRTTGGWVTGTFNFDDFGTGPVESVDLSTLPALTVGLRGHAREGAGAWADLGGVKLEVEDVFYRKHIAVLNGVSADRERVWSVPLAALRGAIDVTKVRFITLVVEGSSARNGQLRAHLAPGREEWANPMMTATHLSGLPGAWSITRVAPEPNATAVQRTQRGLLLQYRTGPEGWAGGGFAFDDFGTPAVETVDLSATDALRFGLSGGVTRVKLELVDDQNRKYVTSLQDIAPDEKVWVVPLSRIGAYLDARRVRLIYFIVEGAGLSGNLWVNVTAPGTSASSAAAARSAESGASSSATGWGRVLVFPNPAVGVDPTFRVECAGADGVDLTIVSLAGRVVGTASLAPAGAAADGRAVYEHRWSASDAASGVYFYRLTARGAAGVPPKTGKIAILR